MNEVEIMQIENWSVRERESSSCEWRSLVVRKQGGQRKKFEKRNYWFGWNGERFAQTDDFKKISLTYPNLVEKIQRHLEAN